jgi:hypothetical protein
MSTNIYYIYRITNTVVNPPNPDGHQENISGLNQFCKLHNLSQSAMSEVFAGHRPRHKQFKCAKVA